MEWAEKNRKTDWKDVIFSDESIFTIGETGTERVIRKRARSGELNTWRSS